MQTLRWEQQGNSSWFGYSGELMVAMVVRVLSTGESEGWNWRVDGGRNPVGWVNAGYRKSADAARLAAVRYWKRWLDHAELLPTPSAGLRAEAPRRRA